MLNQTLTEQALRALINLKSNHNTIRKALLDTLKAELEAVKNELLTVKPEYLATNQGKAEQLKELIQLIETPEGFSQLFE